MTKGALDMLSTPPAITTSASPVLIDLAAAVNASRPEPQSLFTVAPVTEVGSPDSNEAILATLRLSSPAWFTQP